jgi:hypothetical protein
VSLFGGVSSPGAPPFKKVNVGKAADAAQNAAVTGYNFADADFLDRFKGLVGIRDQEITDAAKEVTGPLDPTVQNVFANKAYANTLGAFGGNTGSIGEAGSAARGSIASEITTQVSDKQDTDWQNLMSLIDTNKERTFGLNGQDLLNLLIGNVVGKNQAGFQGFASNVAQSNAQNAAQTQEAFAGAGLVISALAAY